MVNTRQKMKRTNSKIRLWMEENRFEDIWFFPHTRFSKDYHFQGEEFDGMASHKNKLVLFQCKTNYKATKKIIKRYAELSERFGIKCIWFNVVDRRGLQINNEWAK